MGFPQPRPRRTQTRHDGAWPGITTITGAACAPCADAGTHGLAPDSGWRGHALHFPSSGNAYFVNGMVKSSTAGMGSARGPRPGNELLTKKRHL